MRTMPVDHCHAGDTGKIVELATRERTILAKLMSLGIVPGAQIRVLRSHPVILLQSGHTKVALDRYLAAHVIMETR